VNEFDADCRRRLIATFRWVSDKTDPSNLADVTGWWRDPLILRDVGRTLANLYGEQRPTAVMGPQSRGSLLGVLCAESLGVGFVEVRKNARPSADSDAWWTVSTAPDYQDRHLELGVRRMHLRSGDRVLFVDDWIDTGAQADACKRLVEMSGAEWIGAAVVVDALHDAGLRRRLGVRSVLHVRDL